MKCISDYTQIWVMFIVIMAVADDSKAEEGTPKKVRGRTGYSLNGGLTANESITPEVNSPLSKIKEGFITEVTYTSGEDLVAKLNKKKELVKFVPVYKNITDKINEEKYIGDQREEKPKRKKVKVQKFEEAKNNEETTTEQRVRIPVRNRFKVSRQTDEEKSKKEYTKKSDDEEENYPKGFSIKNAKSYLLKPITPISINNNTTAKLKEFLSSKSNQIRKGRSETEESVLGSQSTGDEKLLDQVKKIAFPPPVKDLVILKPESQQQKKLLKLEDIVSKQKQLKPEHKLTTVTTELPVQIKKLNLTRKQEQKLVTTTTEQSIKIKKLDLVRPNQLSQNLKNHRDTAAGLEEELIKTNKESFLSKKFPKPEIKQVPVRVLSSSDINVPKLENNFEMHSTKKYYDKTKEISVETTSRKPPSLKLSPLKNNFKLQPSVSIPDTNYYDKLPSSETTNQENNYDEPNDYIAVYNFDYSPESNTQFGSKTKSLNGLNSKKQKFNTQYEDTEFKYKQNQKPKEKKPIGRFKNKLPAIKNDENNYPKNKGRPDSKKQLDIVKTISNSEVIEVTPELDKDLDHDIQSQLEVNISTDTKSTDHDIVTEIYHSVKPIPKPRNKDAELRNSNQIVSNGNKKRKKLKKKHRNKDAASELLNRLTNTFHKDAEEEGNLPLHLGNNNVVRLHSDVHAEQIETSTSHYLHKYNSPKFTEQPSHYHGDDGSYYPYKTETTTQYYQGEREISQTTSIDDFERLLKDLSANLNSQKHHPEPVNHIPLPTSSSNQVDYFTPSHSDDEWQPITYSYVPKNPSFNSHHNSHHFESPSGSFINYYDQNTDYKNADHKFNSNNYHYDYSSSNNKKPSKEVTFFFNQKGSSVFSSGINGNGQSYYGYRISSPVFTNEEPIFKPSYNQPNDYHNFNYHVNTNYDNVYKPHYNKPKKNHNYNHHTSLNINSNDPKSPFEFNRYIPNHKPSYDSVNYNYNDDKHQTFKSPFYSSHSSSFTGNSGYKEQDNNSNYIATSHQSLIRLSENNHPLKSYHDFVIHHRY